MATLASKQTGNFTAAATWAVVNPTSYLPTETSTQALTVAPITGSAFTPGAITIDGIGIRVLLTATTPVGTFTLRLLTGGSPVVGTTVTINVSDIPNGTNSIGGWIFFKFAAPVTLLAATAYNVSLNISTAGQVTCYRDATSGNWCRFLRTTTTQAPAAGDSLIVTGEYTGTGTSNTLTVTMDNTAATVFADIEVCGKGVLSYGVAAATNYLLKSSGICRVTGAGTWTIGTLASPIPASSTATLNFVNTVNADFGLEIRGVSTFTTYGATKIGRAYLNVDAAAAATSITTDISTSWSNGDAIALASTTITMGQTELVTLTGNATGTTVPITALGFAHSGTNPTKGEIINLTRNVKISGTSLTLGSYIQNSAIGAFAAISCNYTEFQYMGSATTNKRGFDIATTGVGSTSFSGCAFKNFEVASSIAINIAASVSNTTINDCVFYRINAQAVAFSSSALASCSLTNCWGFVNLLSGNSIFTYSSPLPTMTGIVGVSSTSGYGISLATNDMILNTVSNLTGHSNGVGGIAVTATSQMSTPPVISNLTSWRNASVNFLISGCNNIVFDTISTFSAVTTNINLATAVNTDIQFRNVVCNGGISPTTANGVNFVISGDRISFVNSFFGTVVNHTTADINSTFVRGFLGATFYNCQFGSSTTMTGLNIASYNSYIASSKHNGISGAHQTYTPLGYIAKDTAIFDTTNLGLSASTRLVPSTVASPLHFDKIIAVPFGRQLRISVAVRQSSIANGVVYNGMLPQLIVRKNHSIGLTTDTVIATATVASAGAFEVISGITPVASDSGAFTISVACNGTAGWINVDSFKVEVV